MNTPHDELRKPTKLYVLCAVFTFLMICMLIFFATGGRGVSTRSVTTTIGIAGIQSSSDADKVRSMFLESLPELRGLHFGK